MQLHKRHSGCGADISPLLRRDIKDNVYLFVVNLSHNRITEEKQKSKQNKNFTFTFHTLTKIMLFLLSMELKH